MSEISETKIKSMTKEQNYMCGYKDGRSDVLDKIRAEFVNRYPKNYAGEPEMGGMNLAFSLNQVLQIIDKYKESEGE